MKRGFYIVLAIVTIIVGVSCSKTKSYTEYLNDQKDAIKSFFDENGLEELREYPSNGVFKPNQFVNLDGIYMNVIDSGRGEKATTETRVYCRASGYILYDSIPISNFYNGSYPVEFTYGAVQNGKNDFDGVFLSVGLEVPLAFVRDSAEVKLIVPFQYGSSYASSKYTPVYYDRVRYIFKK